MTPDFAKPEPGLRFLEGCGEMGALVRAFAWDATSLGSIDTWPQSRKTAVSIALQSPVPIATLWGPEGVMIYNDAYAVFSGARHPGLLGAEVRSGWQEAATFNDNVMRTCLGGRTLAFRDIELTLHRTGRPEQVWMNLDYSPLLDEDGWPVGVIAIVVETTDRVMAERRIAAENERLMRLFEQSPSFMAILAGEDHRFELVSPGYRRLVGPRELIGRTMREAMPEVVGQGFISLLDRVRDSGEAVQRIGAKVTLDRNGGTGLADAFVDFVFQPIKDDGGRVARIFVQGSEVTDRVLGERQQRLLINELNHRVKNTLATVLAIANQTLRSAASLEAASVTLDDRILALARAQDILTQESWTGADLAAIVDAAVDTLAGGARCRVSGPSLRLAPRPTLSLSLALHELATNATKYGALSSEQGRVAIAWRVEREAARPTLRFEWRESGGPTVSPPLRRGFGSTLIERSLAAELDAEVTLDYAPTGLVMTVAAPLASIEEAPTGGCAAASPACASTPR